MMARNLLESFKILTNSSRLFAERCIDGLVANEERLRELAESSPSIVTPLNSAIGYEEAAAVAKQALKEKKTIRQTVIDRGLIGDKLSLEELDKRLDVLAMAKVKRTADERSPKSIMALDVIAAEALISAKTVEATLARFLASRHLVTRQLGRPST